MPLTRKQPAVLQTSPVHAEWKKKQKRERVLVRERASNRWHKPIRGRAKPSKEVRERLSRTEFNTGRKYAEAHGHTQCRTCEYVRGLIASGNTPRVLLTHVTTVGPVDFSMSGCVPMMSMRSVALPL